METMGRTKRPRPSSSEQCNSEIVDLVRQPGYNPASVARDVADRDGGAGLRVPGRDRRRRPGGAGSEQRPIGAASTYVVCDDPDALFDRATAAGAEEVRELRDEDYGSRGFTVRDPEGNLWSFGTYQGS